MAKLRALQGDDEYVGSRGIIKKGELVRIIAAALYSLGYPKSGEQLENESGIEISSPSVVSFERQILDGKWELSVRTLSAIGIRDQQIKKLATVLILEQKYVELLHQGKTDEAVQTLRSKIVPLSVDEGRILDLTRIIVKITPADEASRRMFEVESRKKLLEELRMLLQPKLVPQTKLISLVEQALGLQLESCRFHNSSSKISVLADHHPCGMDNIPSQTLQVLDGQGAVWFLQFSHNGEYLASSSADCCVIIWEVKSDGEVSMKHKLSPLHQKPVCYISWSPDDKQILTCGVEETVRRWDVASGACLFVYEKAGLGLISCAWGLDRKTIFTGVTDQTISRWDLEGMELDSFPGQKIVRISDMGSTADGEKLITVCNESSMLLFDWKSLFEMYIKEDQEITSFAMSEDRKYLLVSLANARLDLWSVDGFIPERRLCGRYKCYKSSRHVVRPCFGGHNEAYFASGSKDAEVYIWERRSKEPIATLKGHTGALNCVSWNPANPHMLASASEDRTIRIWGRRAVKKSLPNHWIGMIYPPRAKSNSEEATLDKQV